ncbi:MAG: hypothetical protein FJW31_01295 [Acidobacteria bacterium]|nr:hypothetical protein [Acidobacteriota bacterium]
MYDAYFGIAGGHNVYTPGLIAPAPGASKGAAIAAAAHFVLKALYPSQQPYLDGRLASAPTDMDHAANGKAYGRDIGAKLTLLRANDRHVGDGGYVANKHRPIIALTRTIPARASMRPTMAIWPKGSRFRLGLTSTPRRRLGQPSMTKP